MILLLLLPGLGRGRQPVRFGGGGGETACCRDGLGVPTLNGDPEPIAPGGSRVLP